MKLAQRLAAIQPSPTLSLNAKARAMAARGEDVLSFAAGEPDFDTPDFIKQAAIAALRGGFTKYTATAGIPELREAICAKLARDNGLAFAADQVIVSCGAKHALYNTFQALLNPGDEVIVVAPYWVSYPDIVRLAEGVPVVIPGVAERGYAPDPEVLQRALTPRTRAVILNSPSNPTGGVMSDAALTAMGEVLRRHDCLIVTDDIYEKLLYREGPFHNLANVAPDLAPRTVVVNGFSKAFSMTGWRLGYAAGPRELVAAMQNLQDQSTSNPNSIAQKAGVAALAGPPDALVAMVAEFKARRDLLVRGLNALPGVDCRVPEGAFYAFPSFAKLLSRRYRGQPLANSTRLSEVLLTDFRLAAVPGLPFGAEGHLRLSFATSRATLERGLGRLADFVRGLEAA